ncbi:MAG: cyclic nucleotide-binding domain-containing protein [Gemmatimonadetes bacterium]|nr:cyclic nucleotide-binding domain-containing protein [Gemmatimonadota bacterium]
MTQTEQGWSSEQVMELLDSVELFRGLPEDDLRRVADIVTGTSADAGEVLFEEGEVGDAFFIVYKGSVEITKSRPDGTPERLAVRRAGEAFGEMALLNDAPRSARARATEASQLVVIPREGFQELLGRDSLALRVLRLLSRSLRSLGVRFASLERESLTQADVQSISRILQQGLLPRNAPRVSGYDIAAGTTTEDGGAGTTVWDSVALADGRTALLTLYVHGGALPPAQHLATARGVFRAVAADHGDLRRIMPRVNAAMAASAVEGLEQFVECGVLVPAEEGLEWVSAGRVPCGVIRRDGSFQEMGSHGPPLGMMEGFQYGSQSVPMGVGDTAFVLSHGPTGVFRGAADLVAQLPGKPAGEVVATLHKALRKAQGEGAEEISVLFVRKH